MNRSLSRRLLRALGLALLLSPLAVIFTDSHTEWSMLRDLPRLSAFCAAAGALLLMSTSSRRRAGERG